MIGNNYKFKVLREVFLNQVLQKFGVALGTEMGVFYGDVSKSRNELEGQSVDAATTSEAVGFITYVQGLKRNTNKWQGQV